MSDYDVFLFFGSCRDICTIVCLSEFDIVVICLVSVLPFYKDEYRLFNAGHSQHHASCGVRHNSSYIVYGLITLQHILFDRHKYTHNESVYLTHKYNVFQLWQ